MSKATQEVCDGQGTVQAAGTTHPSPLFTPLQSQLPFQSNSIFYPLQFFCAPCLNARYSYKQLNSFVKSNSSSPASRYLVASGTSSSWTKVLFLTLAMEEEISKARVSILKCRKSGRIKPTPLSVFLKQTLAPSWLESGLPGTCCC